MYFVKKTEDVAGTIGPTNVFILVLAATTLLHVGGEVVHSLSSEHASDSVLRFS